MAGWRVLHRLRARASRRVVGWSLCVIVPATAAGLGLAVTHRPGWYRPTSVDHSRLRADKAALADLQEQISAALNSGREVRFQLHEDQLNRWLAARAEIWPESATELDRWQHPQVSMADGHIRLAATATCGSFQAIVALTCRVEVSDNEVVLRYDAFRLGALPIPRGWVSNLVGGGPAPSHPALRSGGSGTLVVVNGWTWPNGRRRCRLRSLAIAAGVADVVIEPCPGRPR
jgi:hypothetical protein